MRPTMLVGRLHLVWRLSCLQSPQFHFPVTQRINLCPVRHASAEALVEYARMTNKDATEALNAYKILQFVKDPFIKESSEKLIEMGMSYEDIHKFPNVLGIRAASIINYSELLKECGFTKINTGVIVQCSKKLMKKSIYQLKLFGYIPQSLEVVPHILNQIPDLPKKIAIAIQEKIGTIDENSTTLTDLHRLVRLHYLCWHFSTDKDTINRIIDTYYRIKYRSICGTAKTIQFLTEIGFTDELILRNGYLLHGHTCVMQETLQKLPTLGGMPILDVVLKNPRFLLLNTQSFINTTNVLHEFGITDEAISRCIRIFTLSTDTIRERIVQTLENPLFCCMRQHPRFLLLVLHSRLVSKRLEMLQKMNMKCYSLQLVSATPDVIFERFTAGREDRSNGGDVICYISYVLGCNSSNLRNALNRHPHWHHIPANHVHSTLLLLAQRGFYPEHIRQSVQILIYPTEQVAETLDAITYHKPEDAQDWSDRLSFSDKGNIKNYLKSPTAKGKKYVENSEFTVNLNTERASIDMPVVEWQYVLPMSLYLLEKKHHFSGDGVWVSNKEEKEVITTAN